MTARNRKLILMRFGVNERHTPSDVQRFIALGIVVFFLCALLAFVGAVIYTYGPVDGLPILILALVGLGALLVSIARGGSNAQG